MFIHNNEQRILDNPIETLKEYSEGDELLNQALLTCYKYNLMTEGCCKGHPEEEKRPYLSIILTAENENLLKKLFTVLYDRGKFNVGFSAGLVNSGRLILFIGSTGTNVNWNIITNLINSLSNNKEQIQISNSCHLALNIAKKYFMSKASNKNVYTELSQDGELYIHLPDIAVINKLENEGKMFMLPYTNANITFRRLFPFGTAVLASGIESPDDNYDKMRADRIMCILDNIDNILETELCLDIPDITRS